MAFARKTYERKPQPAYAPVARRGTYSHTAAVQPIAKTEPHRNRHLLDMARGRPCLFHIRGVCNMDPSTTVACHSNLGIHGKGGARKADDEYSAWGCSRCHIWLDSSYSATGAQREAAFMLAHLAQVGEWRAIAISTASTPADRAAALWALNHLNATPSGQLETP